MADVFSNSLRLREQESGSNAGTWGGLLNTTIRNIASAFGQGSETIPNASTHTITLADGVADEARSLYLKCTGGGQACTVTLAPNTISKVWIISNETSFTLTFSQGSGANVAVAAGAVKVIATDGAGSGAAVVDAFTDLSVPSLFVSGNATFADNAKAIFGAGSDLQIYHDGSHSYVSDQGTGNIKILADDFVLKNSADTETMIQAFTDAAVSLWFDNSAKLATTSTGIDVTGTATMDGLTVQTTNGLNALLESTTSYQYLQFKNSAETNNFIGFVSDDFVVSPANNQKMIVTAQGLVGIGTSSPSDLLTLGTNSSGGNLSLNSSSYAGNGLARFFGTDGNEKLQIGSLSATSAYLYTPASTDLAFFAGAAERMRIDSSGNVGIGNSNPAAFNTLSGKHVVIGSGAEANTLTLFSDDTNDVNGYGHVAFADSNVSSSTAQYAGLIQYFHGDNSMRFFTNATEGMRIDSNGSLLVGTTARLVTEKVRISSTSASQGIVITQTDNANAHDKIIFTNTNGIVGYIRTTGTTTAYVTSSDQRLKENIADADDAGSKVDAIQVRKFDWIADGLHQDYGMVAQELQTVAPEAVSGDADSDEMMGVDYSKLVPMLVKEIQSLRARVQQLEND